MRKKFYALFVVMLLISSNVFAQRVDITRTHPMDGWQFTDVMPRLNGRYFLQWEYAQSWNEQSGYALVQERRLFYWLYDSITYHGGNAADIYNKIIPSWVENLGYTIDYDSVYVSDPNTALASSVRTLMRQRGCDISVTITTGPIGPITYDIDYLIINEYFPSKGTYKFTQYSLRRYYNLR